jgi:DNA-binding NtrC family response regulator
MTRRYLIVDDNAAFAENLAEILRDAGAEVTVASDGQQALELARGSRFDALVTDMRMPVMSGARLVHEVRRVDPDLPAIVVTAYTGEDDLLAARDEGLLAVLPKPAPIDRLLELLARARRGGLVAVVEDDAALADNLTEALRDRGFSAVTAHSVSEAQALADVRPFAALADLRVAGGRDGEALEKLLARFPGLPTLIVTAYAGAPGAPSGLRVFAKPFDTGSLLGEVEALYAGARG